MRGPRLKQTASLEERLKQIAQHCREKVAKLRPGLEREQMLRKARHCLKPLQMDCVTRV